MHDRLQHNSQVAQESMAFTTPDSSRISFSTSTEDPVPAPSTIVWQQPCTLTGLSAGLGAGVLGYVFGVLPSILRNRTLKARGIWHADGVTSFTAFAVMSGLYGMVHCLLVRIRETDDAINRGLAGAASGLVIGWKGGPASALQSAAFIGVLSYVFDFGEGTGAANACCSSCAGDSRHASHAKSADGSGHTHRHAALASSPFASFSRATAQKYSSSSLTRGLRPGCGGGSSSAAAASMGDQHRDNGSSSSHAHAIPCGGTRSLVVRYQKGNFHQGDLGQSPLMWLGTVCNSAAYFKPLPPLSIGIE